MIGNKVLISAITAGLLLSVVNAEEAQKENLKVGANMVIIHEYGSKITFGKGQLKDRKGGTTKVKDAKFRENNPEFFQEFVNPTPGRSPLMITSTFYTGEGSIREGGIYSPNFKNKMNVNNLIYYCLSQPNIAGGCRNALAVFDMTNALYFTVYNHAGTAPNYDYKANSTITKDQAAWAQLRAKVNSEAASIYDKEPINRKLDQIETFLTIAWNAIPFKYDDIASGEMVPYLTFATPKTYDTSKLDAASQFLIKKNENSKLPGIYGMLPAWLNTTALTVSGGGTPPVPTYSGGKLSYPKNINKFASATGGAKTTETEWISFDLASKDLDYLYLSTAVQSEASNPRAAIYPAFSGNIKAGVKGSRKFGRTNNRDTGSIVLGNYVIASKNGLPTADMRGNWKEKGKVYREAGSEIAKQLEKGYINSVRIIERTYGLAPVIKKSGNTKILAHGEFSVMNEYYNVENFFDKDQVSGAYVARFREFVNFNAEDNREVDQKFRFPIEHNAESIYHEYDAKLKKWNVIDPYPGKFDGGKHSYSVRVSRDFTFMGYDLSAGMGKPGTAATVDMRGAVAADVLSAGGKVDAYTLAPETVGELTKAIKPLKTQDFEAPDGTDRWLPSDTLED